MIIANSNKNKNLNLANQTNKNIQKINDIKACETNKNQLKTKNNLILLKNDLTESNKTFFKLKNLNKKISELKTENTKLSKKLIQPRKKKVSTLLQSQLSPMLTSRISSAMLKKNMKVSTQTCEPKLTLSNSQTTILNNQNSTLTNSLYLQNVILKQKTNKLPTSSESKTLQLNKKIELQSNNLQSTNINQKLITQNPKLILPKIKLSLQNCKNDKNIILRSSKLFQQNNIKPSNINVNYRSFSKSPKPKIIQNIQQTNNNSKITTISKEKLPPLNSQIVQQQYFNYYNNKKHEEKRAKSVNSALKNLNKLTYQQLPNQSTKFHSNTLKSANYSNSNTLLNYNNYSKNFNITNNYNKKIKENQCIFITCFV